MTIIEGFTSLDGKGYMFSLNFIDLNGIHSTVTFLG